MFAKLKNMLFSLFYQRRKKITLRRGGNIDCEIKNTQTYIDSIFAIGYMPAHVDFFKAVSLRRKVGNPRELIESIKKDMSLKPGFKSERIKVKDIFIGRCSTDMGNSFPWSELYEVYLKGYGVIGYVNRDMNLNGSCNAHVKDYFRKNLRSAEKNDLFISYGYWYAKLKLENNEKTKS